MRRDLPLKHFATAFLIALVGYAAVYSGIEYLRNRKGPWEVTFLEGGTPAIVINQPRLAIKELRLSFPTPNQGSVATNAQDPPTNESLTRTLFLFRNPRPVPYDVPFGKCLFMDTTFLPGTVTFQLCGHEIELLPRVLIIDHQEHAWKSGETITLPQVAPSTAPKPLPASR